MNNNLFNFLTSEANAIIKNPNNWSKDYMPDICAVCKKAFKDHEVPLILWANKGKWAIQFHMKCAFGKNIGE